METNCERRRRKLLVLATQKGGVKGIATAAGLSPASLEQVIKGTLLPMKKVGQGRSPRNLGDSAARSIEGAFKLERGWFDNDAEAVDMTGPEFLLLGYFRALDANLQALVIENVREAAERKAAIAETLAQTIRLASKTTPAPR